MKFNKWTLALATAGVISYGSVALAEEAPHQVLTALSSTTLSGYIDTSANWRPGNNQGMLPGRTFDGGTKQDGFNLNIVSLTLEKPLDEGQWSAGYKAQLVFGPDAGYYTTTSDFNPLGGVDGSSDFNIKNAYAALRAPVGNGIDIKAGVFDTLVGYEVFESANNPNYSRSYGYALEPTHHTGILASYHINDMVSVAAGVANTAFGPINGKFGIVAGKTTLDSSQKTYMAAVTVTLPESTGPLAGTALYAGVVDGRAFGNPEDSTSYYTGVTLKTPLEGLAVGAAVDYIENKPFNGTAFAAGSLENWAWATAVYASYQATEQLRLNARGDYTRGTDGTFYDRSADGMRGGNNELASLTLTADYSLWSSLVTRLEGRWDHALNGDRAFANAAGKPDDNNALTVALNMIYKF